MNAVIDALAFLGGLDVVFLVAVALMLWRELHDEAKARAELATYETRPVREARKIIEEAMR